jgi:nucleotide-binding universal stress UspA family protein
MGLLVGSVSNRCIERARCPVAVVRDAPEPHSGPEKIVVGVDGSDGAREALAWALDAARARGAEVEVIHAWHPAIAPGTFAGTVLDPTLIEDAARRALNAIVDASDTRDITVIRSLVCGGAAPALLQAAAVADVVAVGSRGLGSMKSLVLGSVSRQVAHHAPCPVVVVPAPDAPEE